MAKTLEQKRKITTDQAMKILNGNGIKVNKEEAKEILNFLYLLAETEVNQYMKK